MVFENKLGIKNQVELLQEEEKISKKKAKEMFENGILNKLNPGTFECLKKYTSIYLRIYYI